MLRTWAEGLLNKLLMSNLFNRATQSLESLNSKLIEEYLPASVAIIKSKGGPHVIDLLDDDERMEDIINVTYQSLPLPARLAIKQGAFADYIHNHKEKIRTLLSEDSNPSVDDN